MPAILFIPGLLCDETLWRAQADSLGGAWDNFTGDTTQDDSIAGMAKRMLASMPPRFALCALSMGGYVAMEIMRVSPQRVTHLVLADTTARQDDEAQRQRRLDFIALAQRGKFKGVTPRLLPQLLAPASLDKPAITQTVIDMALALGRDIYIRQQTAIMGRIDSRESLKAVTCPTVIIVGEHDALTPPDVAAEMAELIPAAQLHVIAQAGHLTPLERPELFNKILHSCLSVI